MTHVTVADQTPRISYSPVSPQTVFAVPFPFFALTDLTVFVNGTMITYDAAPADATEFSVIGNVVDGGFQGGSITLGASISSGTLVIERNVPISRTTDFPYPSNTLSILELNTQIDRWLAIAQQLRAQAARVLSLPPGDPADSLVLPSKADRSGKYLKFDANGDPIAVVDVVPGVLTLPVSIANGGTGTGTAAGARTAFAVPGLATANNFTAAQTEQLSDNGAALGPVHTLDRLSSSPAASDLLGATDYAGRDSAGNVDVYAREQAEIVDPTSTSEDGLLGWWTRIAGTLARRFWVGAGVVIGSPLGGDKGAGTANSQNGYYDNNVRLTPSKLAQRTHGTVSAAVSVAADIPVDDTIPQSGEGTQILSHNHTPLSATNKLLVTVNVFLSSSGGGPTAVVALFRDAVANALAAVATDDTVYTTVTLQFEMDAGTTSAIAFKVRVGNGGGTVVVNGVSGGTRLFGAIPKTTITVEEYVP